MFFFLHYLDTVINSQRNTETHDTIHVTHTLWDSCREVVGYPVRCEKHVGYYTGMTLDGYTINMVLLQV